MSGRIPGIKEAGNMRRCSFIISLTQAFRMATTAFICDVEDSEGSVPSLKLKQRSCSYTLLKVLVGVMAVLLLAMTGWIIWMKLSKNCPESSWNIMFTGTRELKDIIHIDTDFTSPRSEKYEIRGKIFFKDCSGESCNKDCIKVFRLGTEMPNNGTPVIQSPTDWIISNITEEVIVTVVLEKGSRLIIQLNCIDMKIDEAKSTLNVYQKTC